MASLPGCFQVASELWGSHVQAVAHHGPAVVHNVGRGCALERQAAVHVCRPALGLTALRGPRFAHLTCSMRAETSTPHQESPWLSFSKGLAPGTFENSSMAIVVMQMTQMCCLVYVEAWPWTGHGPKHLREQGRSSERWHSPGEVDAHRIRCCRRYGQVEVPVCQQWLRIQAHGFGASAPVCIGFGCPVLSIL